MRELLKNWLKRRSRPQSAFDLSTIDPHELVEYRLPDSDVFPLIATFDEAQPPVSLSYFTTVLLADSQQKINNSIILRDHQASWNKHYAQFVLLFDHDAPEHVSRAVAELDAMAGVPYPAFFVNLFVDHRLGKNATFIHGFSFRELSEFQALQPRLDTWMQRLEKQGIATQVPDVDFLLLDMTCVTEGGMPYMSVCRAPRLEQYKEEIWL